MSEDQLNVKDKEVLINASIDLPLFVLGVILSGFTLSYMWLWFVVPFGIAPINIAHALGLGLMVRILSVDKFVKVERIDRNRRRIMRILFPVVVFINAWVYHLFV